MAAKKTGGVRAKLTREEYDLIKSDQEKGKNAYEIYREQKEKGSIRSYSFWTRWFKRIANGQTFEEYGKANYIPDMTNAKGNIPEKPRQRPNFNEPKESTDTTEDPVPDTPKEAFGIDLREYSEAGILKVQEAIEAIASVRTQEQVEETINTLINNVSAQAKTDSMQAQLDSVKAQLEKTEGTQEETQKLNRELRRENRGLRSEISDLGNEIRKLERDVRKAVGDKRAVEVVQGYHDNLRELVAEIMEEKMRDLIPRVTDYMKVG